jgi:hypothetical protein
VCQLFVYFQGTGNRLRDQHPNQRVHAPSSGAAGMGGHSVFALMRRSPETVTLLCHGPSMLTHVTLLYKAHVASELEACEALRRFDPPLHVHVCSVSNCLACLCTLPTPCRARNWRHRACTHHSVKMITLCVRPRTQNVGMSEEVKESAGRWVRMCVCVFLFFAYTCRRDACACTQIDGTICPGEYRREGTGGWREADL